MTETPAEGYDTTVSDGSGVIEAGRRQTAAFVNRYGADKPGNGQLTIRKSVTGGRGDRSRQFTFTVTLADALGRPLTAAYPYSGSKSGTITLKDGAAEASFVNHKPKDHSGNTKTELTVKKQWAGSGSHPASVLMQLLRNGEPYGSPVRLRTENGWSYTWTGLSRSDRWTVEEIQVPEGYQASVSYAGTVWTVTNTPDTPDQPEVPDQPETPDKPSVPDRTPKTGDEAHPGLWSALLGVSLAGLAASLAAVRKRRCRGKRTK